MKKKLFQNQYYSELDADSAKAPKPGAFYYGPVFYDVNVVATVRPVTDAQGRILTTGDGRPRFNIEMPLPDDAYKRPTPIGKVIKPYEELVAVPGKMRPFVILSPEEANTGTVLALPSFKLENFDLPSQERIRANGSILYFYLPACPELDVLESALSFQKIQPVRLDPKLVNPGNRKANEKPRHLRLSDETFAALRTKLNTFLTYGS